MYKNLDLMQTFNLDVEGLGICLKDSVAGPGDNNKHLLSLQSPGKSGQLSFLISWLIHLNLSSIHLHENHMKTRFTIYCKSGNQESLQNSQIHEKIYEKNLVDFVLHLSH